MLILPPAAIDPVSLALVGGLGAMVGLAGLGGGTYAVYKWLNRPPQLLPYIPSYIDKLDDADKTPTVRFIAAYHDMMMFMFDAHNAAISRQHRTLSQVELGDTFMAHCEAVIQHGCALLESLGSSEAQIRQEREAFNNLRKVLVRDPMTQFFNDPVMPSVPYLTLMKALEKALEGSSPSPLQPQPITIPPLSAWPDTEREITRRIIQSSQPRDPESLLTDAEIHRWLTAWMESDVFSGTPGPTKRDRMKGLIREIQRDLPKPVGGSLIPVSRVHYQRLIPCGKNDDFVHSVYVAIWRARNYQEHASAVSPRTMRRALPFAIHLYLRLTHSPHPNPLRDALVGWGK